MALVWPTADAGQTSRLYPVDDGYYMCSVDPIGRQTVVLHPDQMWRIKVDPSGRARCLDGHPVGTVTTGENPPPWYISLWTDRVLVREMHGSL